MESLVRLPFGLDPHFINFDIFALCGFWHISTDKKWKNSLYSVVRYVYLYILTFGMAIHCAKILENFNHLEEMVTDMFSIVVSINVTVNIYLLTFRSRRVEKLHENFVKVRSERTKVQEIRVLNQSSRSICGITAVYYVNGVLCVLLWMSFPMLEKSSSRKLPYPYILPVDIYKSPYYEIMYVYECFSFFLYLINLVSVNLGFCGLVLEIICQYRFLFFDMDSAFSCSDRMDDWKGERELKKTLRMHNHLLEEIKKLGATYEPILGTHFFCAVFMLAALTVDMSLGYSGLDLKFFQRLSFMVGASFDLFMVSYWCSQLEETGWELCFKLYSIPWLSLGVGSRKMLLMMLCKAQDLPKIRVGPFIINNKAFQEIMRASYNIGALLRQTN